MKEIRLDWKDVDDQQWDRLFDQVPRSNIFQHRQIGQALAKTEGMTVEPCMIYRGSKAIGIAQLYVKRNWLGIKTAKLIRGPLFTSLPSSGEMIQTLKLIKARYPLLKASWCSLQPELPDSEATHATLQKAGLNRMTTGYSSAWLNLATDETQLRRQLHSKWRNQLSKAEKSGLTVQIGDDHSALIQRHGDHMKQAGFSALSPDSYKQIPHPLILHLEACRDKEPVAALMILLHGSCATYQISWTNEHGREMNAVNLLLWQAILKLKALGISNLDLGGMDPIKNEGLARFKSRLGGESFTLAGTYI